MSLCLLLTSLLIISFQILDSKPHKAIRNSPVESYKKQLFKEMQRVYEILQNHAPTRIETTTLLLEMGNAVNEGETESQTEEAFKKYEEFFPPSNDKPSLMRETVPQMNSEDTAILLRRTKTPINVKHTKHFTVVRLSDPKISNPFKKRKWLLTSMKRNFFEPIISPSINHEHERFQWMDQKQSHDRNTGVRRNGFDEIIRNGVGINQKENDPTTPNEGVRHQMGIAIIFKVRNNKTFDSSESTDGEEKLEFATDQPTDSTDSNFSIIGPRVFTKNQNFNLVSNQNNSFGEFNMPNFQTTVEDFRYLESPYSIGILCGLAFLILLLFCAICVIGGKKGKKAPTEEKGSDILISPEEINKNLQDVETKQNSKSYCTNFKSSLVHQDDAVEELRNILREMKMPSVESGHGNQCLNRLLNANEFDYRKFNHAQFGQARKKFYQSSQGKKFHWSETKSHENAIVEVIKRNRTDNVTFDRNESIPRVVKSIETTPE
ncbi:uncharacterized protein [Parasteatoda tepidariorum]|uniref:uncharacterized protein n=1 Tax=Parasteatoda tepidariorum TaxID=114398 RepID=UPI0039BCCF20